MASHEYNKVVSTKLVIQPLGLLWRGLCQHDNAPRDIDDRSQIKSTPTWSTPMFRAFGLPRWSPIQVLPEVDVSACIYRLDQTATAKDCKISSWKITLWTHDLIKLMSAI